MIRRKAVEIKSQRISGVALVQIIKVDEINKNDKKYYRVDAIASTLKEKNVNISFVLFENSYKVSINELAELYNAKECDDLKNKMAYIELSINDKGYQEVNKILMKVSEEELIYDPRVLIENVSLDIF